MAVKKFDYSKKTQELEDVLAKIRQEDTSFEEALLLHEKGLSLLDELEGFLKTAEVEVKKRTQKDN